MQIRAIGSTGDLDSNIFNIDIDQLSYTYYSNASNQLKSVSDATNNPNGFKDVANVQDFTYDANGNLNTDGNKGITSITYNHLNLPTKILFSGTNRNIVYVYDAIGKKVKKTVTNKNIITTTDYLSGFQYENTALTFFGHAEGYVNNTVVNGANNYNYVYNYTDQTGNVRLSYTKDPSTQQLKILSENNYYAFGLKHEKYNVDAYQYTPIIDKNGIEIGGYYIGSGTNETVGKYKYKYNGQEQQDELGLNITAMDYRHYDNALGRFNCIDVLAEASTGINPYQFSNNNPVFFSDPSGLMVKELNSGSAWLDAMWSNTEEGSNSHWGNIGHGGSGGGSSFGSQMETE